MNIIGLDIATRLTGWTAGDGATRPRLDVMKFPQVDEDYGHLIDLFDQNLVTLIETFRPRAFIYEGPILVVNRKGRGQGLPAGSGSYTDKPMTLRKIYGMGTHLEFVCRRRGIECSEVTLQAIKKEVTGDPNADKARIVAVAERLGLDLPKGPGAKDAADSWGAWLLGLRHYSPELSRRWDKMIWSPRGALL